MPQNTCVAQASTEKGIRKTRKQMSYRTCGRSNRVDQPSQAVITPKKDGQVRLCIDPQELNKALKREHFTLPTLNDNLHELRDAKVFSKADLAAGYCHIKLDEESRKLTTFQTCF